MTGENAGPAKGRILVVEDEAIVALDIRKTLAGCGFEVTATVPSGEEALERVRNDPPDLVLMDIRLQGPLDGLETARRLQEESGTPTIFLTAFLDREMVQRAKLSAAMGYLLKPFEERELCAAVELALHRHHLERERRSAPVGPASGGGDSGRPLLAVRVLGELSLRVDGQTVIEGHQLSRQQRDLLALLLSTPGASLRQEAIQVELWPESNEARARSSFDSLLLRLRRSLEGATGGCRDWLQLSNGVLHLKHCRVDAHEFLEECRAGEAARRRNDLDQATAHLARALDLWSGPFLGGAFAGESAGRYADLLEHSFLEAAESLARLRFAAGEAKEAVRVLERAFLQDPTNDSLVRLLHAALCRSRQQRRLPDLFERHRQALHNEGFPPEEIRSILEELAALPDPTAD